MGGMGWLSTKKRGRDDAQIARDKESALMTRKGKKSAKKPAKKAKKTTIFHNDDDSLDDFVVPDDQMSSEDDDEEGEVNADDIESEEDDELELNLPDDDDSSLEVVDQKPPIGSKKNASASAVDLSSDDSSALEGLSSFTKKKQAPKVPSSFRAKLDESSDDDDLSPKRTTSKFFKREKKRPTSTFSLEDSDEDQKINKSHRRKKKKAKKSALSSSVDSYDEAAALAWALKASTEEAKKPATVINANNGKNDDEENIPLFEEEEEEDNEDEQDEYEEDAKREAGTILEAANDLSAQVLTTMMGWSSSDVPVGMIDGGALNLANVNHTPAKGRELHEKSTDHSWISQEEMRKIMPNATLAEYQLIGVNWMSLLHGMQCHVNGNRERAHNVNGVLADEMGLGKTIQTIAFICWLKQSRNSAGKLSDNCIDLVDSDEDASPESIPASSYIPPHLVVAPPSVLSNWEREFQKFAPHLNVIKYHGSMDERNELQADLKIHLPNNDKVRRRHQVPSLDVILVPISYFQKEKSDDRSFLRKFKYDYMVVDEAHVLKNAKGRRYKTLDSFHTQHRLLLTGTPVQNSPKELMCLLCFLMPLFSKKGGFDEGGNEGGENMLHHFVNIEKAGSDSAAAYRKLKQLFAPFVLRRRKVDVLSQIMPPKIHRLESVELDSSARRIYDSLLEAHIRSKKSGKGANSREHLFTQLRKCAHHPLLLRSRYTSPSEKEHLAKWFHQFGAFRGEACTIAKVREELDNFNDFDIHITALELISENELRREQLGRYVLDTEDLFSSAKCERLRTLLPELISKGHRILMFSVWTTCLDLLSCLLEHLGLQYLRMEGSTAVSERQALIDKFTEETDIPVFLLSTKACGLGINLTAADTCIMHDLDFNPFNDLQAEDRCHRIGQKKPVTIIKMVAKDCVDEDIYNMQQRKARMNAAIMDNPSTTSDFAKEQRQTLNQAVDRYLKSPSMKKRAENREKENSSNSESARV